MIQNENEKPTGFKDKAINLFGDMVEAPFRGVGMIYRDAKRQQDKPIVAAFKAAGGQLLAVAIGAIALKTGVEAVASAPQTLPTFIKAGAAIVGGIISGNVRPVYMAWTNRLEYRNGIRAGRFGNDKPPEVYGYSSAKDFIAWPSTWANRPPDNPPGPPRHEPWWHP